MDRTTRNRLIVLGGIAAAMGIMLLLMGPIRTLLGEGLGFAGQAVFTLLLTAFVWFLWKLVHPGKSNA
jgi:hypothetical protein